MSEESKNEDVSNSNELMSLAQSFDSSQYARDILAATKNGEVDPLKAFVVVKRMEKVAKTVLEDKEFKRLGLDAAERFLTANTKTFDIYSATISKAATYTAFDFTECNHIEWNELLAIKKQVEERMKVIEEELKLLIPKDNAKVQTELGIPGDSKDIVIQKMPFFTWQRTEDQITVKAPKKIQTIGIKFNKV